MTSEAVKFLTAVFSREGHHDELLTGHVPQLTSAVFEDFLREESSTPDRLSTTRKVKGKFSVSTGY